MYKLKIYYLKFIYKNGFVLLCSLVVCFKCGIEIIC